MSTPNKYNPSNNVPTPPNCPHCSQPLPTLTCYQWTMQMAAGLVQVLVTHCPNETCRKVLGSPVIALVSGAQEDQPRIQA